MNELKIQRNGLTLFIGDRSGRRRTFELVNGSQRFVDTLDVTNSTARTRFVKGASEKLASSKEELAWLDDALVELTEQADVADAAESPSQDEADLFQESQRRLDEMTKDAKDGADQLLRKDDIEAAIVNDLNTIGVTGESSTVLLLYLAATSRLLMKPASVIVQGSSSSGKSHLIESVARLIPPEAKIEASSMSANALYYLSEGALVHRVIFAGERHRRQDDESADATRALREMISAGRLIKMIPVKNVNDGGFETKLIERQGPIAFLESTTLHSVFDEDANRCLIVHPDETLRQSQAIIRSLAAGFAGTAGPKRTRDIIERHFALQRRLTLGPRSVIVPQAEQLAEQINCSRVEIRRAFGLFMSIVQAIALLYSHQRDQDGQGRIIAVQADVDLAEMLCSPSLAELLGDKPPIEAERFYDQLCQFFSTGDEFTVAQVATKIHQFKRETIRTRIEALVALGAFELVESSRGSRPNRYRLGDRPQQRIELWNASRAAVQ